jgi:hypothetical protein
MRVVMTIQSSQVGSSEPMARAGLCDSCRHQRIVRNTRGSSFSLCERSRTDERYPKYPRLPVERCPGFERREVSANR